MRISAKMARRVEAGERPARTPRDTRRRGVVKSQSMYPASQYGHSMTCRDRHTCVVDLSEEMEVLGVGSGNLGGDPRDTESSSHSEVRDHSDGQDHSR
jgi:hypothetical protein